MSIHKRKGEIVLGQPVIVSPKNRDPSFPLSNASSVPCHIVPQASLVFTLLPPFLLHLQCVK